MGQMLQSNVASRSHTICSGRFLRIHAPYVKVAKVTAPAAFFTAMLLYVKLAKVSAPAAFFTAMLL